MYNTRTLERLQNPLAPLAYVYHSPGLFEEMTHVIIRRLQGDMYWERKLGVIHHRYMRF